MNRLKLYINNEKGSDDPCAMDGVWRVIRIGGKQQMIKNGKKKRKKLNQRGHGG